MRTFNNESVWDKENQEWVEIYYIDGQEVSVDTYTEQLEVEELATEDVIDENCECCNCPDNSDCVDFECTCGEVVEDETECVFETECYCEECNEEREQELINECLDVVFDSDACVDCTVDKIIETMLAFKELGKLEAKEEMMEFLEG